LTPWSLPPPHVHVLLRGLCGGKVRPLWSSSTLHCLLKISFFSCHGRVRADQNPPSVIRNGWYGWSKPPIRHADRMVWVNGVGMRERRGRSVTPKTDRTTVDPFPRGLCERRGRSVTPKTDRTTVDPFPRNVCTRYIEDKQTYDALAEGLP
jgi:hypothetical protein